MLLTYGPVARHPEVGGCSTQGQMACFLVLVCPRHLHTQLRWGLQGRLPGQPNQLLRLGSRHQAATCWGGAKTGDPGARRSGTGFTSFLELEVPHWNADGYGYGPVCSGRQGGLPVLILCPWWEQNKENTHTGLLPTTCTQFPGLQSQPRPIFSKKPVSCPPSPTPPTAEASMGPGLWGTGPSAP